MTKKIIITSLFLLTLALPISAAQEIEHDASAGERDLPITAPDEMSDEPEDIETYEGIEISTEIPEEEITPEDLEINDPQLLPDSPFYFLKSGWRKVREFFTFNPVAKLRLKQRFASEKLIELQKLAKKGVPQRIIEKATDGYTKESEQIREKVMRLEKGAEESPAVNSFSEKFMHQQMLHHSILEKLEKQVPSEVVEKIRTQRERHLERFGDVMFKLEDEENIPERLESALNKVKGGKFKEFKNMEVLEELEEKMPEQAKETIKKTEARILERFREKLEKMPAQQQERFQQYLETLPGDQGEQLEILENIRGGLQEGTLKQKLGQAREGILERIQSRPGTSCPLWSSPPPDFCKNGRVIAGETDPETDCPLSPSCIIPGETEPGEGWVEAREAEAGEPERIACILVWAPVCGDDGRTYSNTCFAEAAGVKIVSKGTCSPFQPIEPVIPEHPAPPINRCENRWWFDDQSAACQQKTFCGAYLYETLRTFDNKENCARALKAFQEGLPEETPIRLEPGELKEAVPSISPVAP